MTIASKTAFGHYTLKSGVAGLAVGLAERLKARQYKNLALSYIAKSKDWIRATKNILGNLRHHKATTGSHHEKRATE